LYLGFIFVLYSEEETGSAGEQLASNMPTSFDSLPLLFNEGIFLTIIVVYGLKKLTSFF
jgi:hypothetical protein